MPETDPRQQGRRPCGCYATETAVDGRRIGQHDHDSNIVPAYKERRGGERVEERGKETDLRPVWCRHRPSGEAEEHPFPPNQRLPPVTRPAVATSFRLLMGRRHVPLRAFALLIASVLLSVLPLPCATGAPASSPPSPSAEEMTPLQKHVSFFDRNKDGFISPLETYQGLRAIGCSAALSSASALLINAFLGPRTQPGGPPNGKLPSPPLTIYVSNIAKGKHGSDSGVYDTEGRFVPEKFEEIFQKHAHTDPNGLTSNELQEMLKANRVPNDYISWAAASAEWTLLYSLAKDKNGLLSKETIRSVYDGSLFYQLEKKNNPPKEY